MRTRDVSPARNLNDDAEPWGRHVDTELREIKRVVERLTGETRGVRQVVAAAADNADAKVKDQGNEVEVVKENAEDAKRTAEEALDDALGALQYAEDAMAAAKDAWKQAGNQAANWSFEDGKDFWAVEDGTWDVVEHLDAYDGEHVAVVSDGLLRGAFSTAPRVESGMYWRVTAHVRGSGTAIPGLYTFNEALSVFVFEHDSEESGVVSDEWQTVSYTFRVPEEHLTRLTPGVLVTGSVEVDAVQFQDITDATLAQQVADAAQAAAGEALREAKEAKQAAEDAQSTADDAMDVATEAQEDARDALDEARAKIRAGSNIIINGGFEEGLVGWENMEGRGEVTDTRSRSGSYSLSMVPYPDLASVPEDISTVPRSRWYDLPPGVRVVRFEFYHIEDPGGLLGLVMPVFLNSAGELTMWDSDWYSYDLDYSGDWRRITYTITVPEDIASVAILFAWVSTGSNVYFDDVSLIDMTEADLVGKEAALGIENATAEITAAYSTEITEGLDNIMSTVSAEYAAKTDLAEEVGIISSQIEQTVENIDFRFVEVTDSVISVGDELSTYQSEVANYIRFSSEGIELGEANSPFVARLSNTELAFMEGGKRVAYVSNNQLHITNAEIRYNLSLGTPETGFFDWIPRANGNLSFVFREG